jgi:hypothetical protein
MERPLCGAKNGATEDTGGNSAPKPQDYVRTNPAQRAGLRRYQFFIAAAVPSGCDILSHIEEVPFPKMELLRVGEKPPRQSTRS